ncbi:hypothetical protein FEZ51_04140 [Pediococcus stilesii]|uniref:Uncharacterized protein n=1 Tax=Pediococcus stilesii TaxID=331679 RepID=A0A5R9BWF9_9LACO|nr:hypothetical protein [Pediococcus stilesii]TLQ04835.1 hypothetical protein FEZ51_04140 [Pediococcus stilesii]
MRTFTSQSIFEYLQNLVWIYIVGKDNYYDSLQIGKEGGHFTIRFNANHTIDTLSFTDNGSHDSGYNYWSYSDEHQQLLIYSSNHEVRLRLSPPKALNDNTKVLDIINSNDRFITFDGIQEKVICNPLLSGKRMAYLLGHSANSIAIPKLQRNNFNIRLVKSSNSQLPQFVEIQKHLMLNNKIKQIIILDSKTSIPSEYNFNSLSENKILLSRGSGTPKKFSDEFIATNRDLAIELLDLLIVSANRYQLSHNNMLPAWDMLFNEQIDLIFNSRIKLL